MNEAIWQISTKIGSSFPALDETIEVDVCIIGAGITGITCAHELMLQGKSVAILESARVGRGTTGWSTGNLYIPINPLYQTIFKKFDKDTAESVAKKRNDAITYIEDKVSQYAIDCHFTRRPWFGFSNTKGASSLKKEFDCLKEMKLEVREVKDLPFNIPFKFAISLSDQARFNPYRYVLGMAAKLKKDNCHIFEHSHVCRIQLGKPHTLFTEKGRIRAKKVVMATHTPIGIHLKQAFLAPYRSYVVATANEKSLPDAHLWNFDNFHTYSTHAISREKPDYFMISGSHHKVGQGSERYSELKSELDAVLPRSPIDYQWSAQHYRSADNLPYIGKTSDGIYMASGFFTDGLVYGTLAGSLIAELIAHDKSHLFAASRLHLSKAMPFLLKENINVLGHYLQDLPIPSRVTLDSLKRGEGKILQINQEKWAASRSKTGTLHVVSAVCPHMKCIVDWNAAEQTWDCPCHGSRFTNEGYYIEGPALSGLTPYKDDEHG